MKSIYLAAGMFALSAAPAMAQEETSFNGFNIGLMAGYDHVTLDDGTDKGSKDGAVFGIVAGFDKDLGSAVVGIEAEINESTVQDSVTDLVFLGDELTVSAKRDLYVGVRAGFKAAPNVLVYAKGGYTNARVGVTYDDGDGSVFKEGRNLDGFRLGAGVEYALGGKLALRGEYRYSDYGNTVIDDFNTGVSARRHQVVASIISRF